MYKNFTGFHLVEAIHKLGLEKKLAFSSKVKKIIYSVIVIAVTLWLWNAPSTMFGIVGLTVIQQRVIAIFAFATLMWIFEIVPAWATSVGIIGLMLIFTSDSGISSMVADGMVDGKPNFIPNILSYKAIMATFADPVIMLFIGGFVLAIAATKTGLDSQMAKVLLKPFGTKPSMVLLGFILITGIFSMFVSNTATAAMMLTFLTPVFKQMDGNGKGRIALALSIPIAANIGGMATPIGTPPNAIAMKYLNDPDGLNMNMGFGQWVSFMLPLTLILLFLGWIILLKIYPFTQKTLKLEIEGKMKKDRKTYIVIVTFFVTVLLWMFDKFTGINSYTVAMIPLIVFALTGVVDRRDLEEINWSVIWMVAGGFALGYGLNASGLAENAVNSIPFGSWSPIVIMLISGLVCYLLSNFISNSATAALLMPILAVVCGAMGDKLGAIGGTPSILIGVAIAASGAMILPISTPPNALAFSTDLVKQKDMAKMGIIMGILTMVIGYTVLYFIGKAGII
ncbi:MAG: SLC13/DASS family transporter [Bacteroidales bacterium]|nr:SLC13/DASS family transporter [Candidatus Scybalousia scybalohippi]